MKKFLVLVISLMLFVGCGPSTSSSSQSSSTKNATEIRESNRDKNNGDDSKIREINEAYAVIGDEDKRKEYDDQNSMGGFGNMFSGFGNGFSGFNFKQMARDINMNITITLEEAYYGCKHPINVNGKLYTVDVPKGITNGRMLRIEGLGQAGYNIYGQPAKGDLIVRVNVQTSDKFSLTSMTNGTTVLEMMQAIDWIDAILGTEMVVKVFDRDVKVRVPKFTQNGGYVMVGGQGFHKYNSDELGSLRVNFIVRMPKSLTDAQIKQLQKIKESLD